MPYAGLAVDANGNLFIADAGNNVVREVSGTPPAASVSGPGTVAEGNPADFQVTLSRPSNSEVTVYYQTIDGTATGGTNYDSQSGSVTVFFHGKSVRLGSPWELAAALTDRTTSISWFS